MELLSGYGTLMGVMGVLVAILFVIIFIILLIAIPFMILAHRRDMKRLLVLTEIIAKGVNSLVTSKNEEKEKSVTDDKIIDPFEKEEQEHYDENNVSYIQLNGGRHSGKTFANENKNK